MVFQSLLLFSCQYPTKRTCKEDMCYRDREALSVMVLCNNNKKRVKYSLVLY